MIPVTYPVIPSGIHNAIAVYPISSNSGLQAWLDYIPVKQSTTGFINSFDGYILSSVLPSITGLQAWKDYIPIFVDNSLTKPFSTDIGGYIPISNVGEVTVNFLVSNLDFLLANSTGDFLISI